MIRILAQGLIYRNPKPHLYAVHAWHPSLVRLDSGSLLASFDLGQGAESFDYRTWLSRSEDDGRTWSEPARLLPDDPPASRPSTHLVRIGRTRDGQLTGFGARHFRDRPDEGLVNRENLGYGPMELFLIRSHDEGRTWTKPAPIVPPLVGPSFEMCHSIVELSDGRWLAPTSTWRGWNGEAPNGMQAVALVSRDEGQTWPEFLRLADRYRDGVICWEVSLVELPNGQLLSVCWAFDERAGRSRPNLYSYSADGTHFSEPAECGLVGQTAKLLVMSDGRLLCLYRREQPPGLWASLVTIDGGRWINHDEAQLWQGAAAGMSGHKPAGDELSALKFGYPTMVELAAGEVLAAFWCVEDCLHVIRWMRLQITQRSA